MEYVDGAFPRRACHQAIFGIVNVGVHAVANREWLANDFAAVRIHHYQQLRIACSNEEPAALPIHRYGHRLSGGSDRPA